MAHPTSEKASILHQEPTGQVKLLEYERRFFDVMTRHFHDRFVQYRKDWSLSSEFAHNPPFPLSLDLEVNASCNLRCIMCVMGGDHPRHSTKPALMKLDLYKNLMRQAEAAGLPAMTFGFLSEPLLNNDLPEMIRLAREAGVMDIRLGTNGLLLNRGMSQKLIKAGLTRLEVSLDADNPATYSRIRRGGNYDLAVKNINDFLDEREKSGSDFPLLRLSFLRLPQNRDELDDFLGRWRGRADLFSIQEPIYFEDAPISKQLVFTECRPASDFRCAQPWQRLIIRANGDVFPCCSIYGLQMKAGSALKSDLSGTWRSGFMKELRLLHKEGRLADNKICRHCASRSAVKPVLSDKQDQHEENQCPRIV